ncbi:TM2 domain-containing protein [Saccharopolyspora griseoalba]|uniref:TM2 domain-containing protein n=1 Tax=Saccharopolyspora griseoalba TaxID=1431848 RepID=A0ABW2LG74_9PSEU
MITAEHRQLMQHQTRARSPASAYVVVAAFGLLGVHRFYLGQRGTGTAQLILTSSITGLPVSAAWVLVDAFLAHQYVTTWDTDLIRELARQDPT